MTLSSKVGCQQNDISTHNISPLWQPGPRFNIKMSYEYRKSHCGDKKVVRSSYLHNGISYTGKTTSLYWEGAQDPDSVQKCQYKKFHCGDKTVIRSSHLCWFDDHIFILKCPPVLPRHKKNGNICSWHFQKMHFGQVPSLRSGPYLSGLILGLRPANERRRYFVTTSLIGWAQD